MLAKLSVKKPYFVFVAVVIILILGGVSLTSMKTDLLPEFQVPYLGVMTTDVGASPEQVEQEVTDPLESQLSTVSGVSSVYSFSNENYSMIFMEFADGTDMDSALVKVSAAANQVVSQLPETVGTPVFMQMSMDMIASMYIGVASDTLDTAQLTQLTKDEIIPALQRVDGVANVSSSGDVVDSIEVKLNQDKIDNVNAGILGEVNNQLADAKAQLDEAEAQLDAAEDQLAIQQQVLNDAKEQAAQGFATVDEGRDALVAAQGSLGLYLNTFSQIQQTLSGAGVEVEELDNQVDELSAQMDTVNEQLDMVHEASAAQTQTILTLAQAQSQLDQGVATIAASRTQLEQGRAEYETQRDAARKQANIDQLVDATTLSGLITAQNLEMPAGYIGDGKGNQWVIKVGEKYDDIDQLRSMVLTHVDGIGDIALGDVADIVTASSEGEAYAKLNGNSGLLLSVTKASTANVGEVSDAVAEAMEELREENPDIHMTAIMDQGSYIDLYINTILRSLLIGAVLAIIVLAVFLKRIKPTLVVAFSIPFSVLFSLVIMYFCGLTINIMTLGAMSLAIGMLVDNSIVVMENIYRLKARGLSATRAAAQGAVQVTGAVVASTITSVCVFMPFVFSTGTVRELMVPFALTISFALLASLLVALSIVPALASKIFVNVEPATVGWFEKIKDKYAGALNWCLDHKAPVLGIAVVLLVAAIAIVVRMGIVMLPTMTSDQISMTMMAAEETEKEDAYKVADEVGARIAKIEGVAEVGIADSGTSLSTVSAFSSAGGSYSGTFLIYATVDPSIIDTEGEAIALEEQILESCKDLDCTLVSSNSMDSLTSLAGSGATVEVSGNDYERVVELSHEVMDLMGGMGGYTEIENGQEDADQTLHLYFDKNKVARMGTTVGQIYQQIAAKLSTTKTAMTMSGDSKSIDVNVDSEQVNDYTRDNILEMEFTNTAGETHKLSEVATAKMEEGITSINRTNQTYTVNVTAEIADGYNVTLLGRELQPALDKIDVPRGYHIEIAGTNADITEMLMQMAKLMILGFVLLYLVMVAQFQSLRSPFIIIFTVPLAFTGGLFALVIAQEQLSMMALLGFVILMGTVVNNGIVFVDFANQLRLGGMAKRAALIATGKTRMRPIIMTALTTIIAMGAMIFSQRIGASMERGMALVVAGGLLYATFMTLFVVPAIYDIFNRKPMIPVDVGSDADQDAGDAEEFIASMGDDARETYEYESRRERRKRERVERAREEVATLEQEEVSEPEPEDIS